MLETLNVALSGLYSSKTQVENVMNNIANENTVGYKKRVVDIKQADNSDSRLTGRGTTVADVSRITNLYIYDNLIKAQSQNSQYNELSTMLADIESIFFETESSGMSNTLDGYFQAIEDLRANPYNEIYRTNLANQGNMLVDSLKSIYTNIEDREEINKNFLYDNVDEINGILHDIGAVNQLIQNQIHPSNDLLDKRDQLESRLSEYVKINVDRSESYSLKTGGVTAVRYNTNIHEVNIVDNSVAQKDVYSTDLHESNLVKPTWDGTGATADSLTYYFNKDLSVTVKSGDSITDEYGTFTVDNTNIVRAMAYKINNTTGMSNNVVAYNGQYSTDENGNKFPQLPGNVDRYLIIESKVKGTDGTFDGRMIANDNAVTDINSYQISNLVEKNTKISLKGDNDIHLEIFNEEIPVESGKIKSILNNTDTTSSENKFSKYKEMLDNFAKAISDTAEAYIFEGEGKYITGEEASLLHKDKSIMKRIGLFEGSDVKTLSFNSSKVGNLAQADLDYLSTIHWNENIKIDGTNATSFSKFYQNIRVAVSADKENVDYMKDTQIAVTESLTLTYDKLVKVDKDDEMVNLIKFQSAYEANAKLITIVDEMLQTILGMKR